MSRLQSIENALMAINETVFQELCDSFMVLRHPSYTVFSRNGSQSAKQKTIKGSPDSFFLMHDGKYLMIEYSTNITRGAAKLEEDILKCLDESITKIPVAAVSEIILCINFNLSNAETDRLNGLLDNHRMRLTIYTLDALAIELHINHRNLANQYLGLPLDTGQVVTMEQFINEYNNAYNRIATPLDNPFHHRQTELKALDSMLCESDFIILSGPAGVGKTKLALQAINDYIGKNTSFKAFCISYKNHTLFDDLQQHLQKKGNHILFVDDANRIDAFSQILGFKKALREGQLKIVVTVRDYAYPDLKKVCAGIHLTDVEIEKLSDDAIRDIISGAPWEVKNQMYQEHILAVAEGNPRLAIMMAQLAVAEQNVETLYDVSDLFDTYFGTFIKDRDEISDDLTIKILGLIGFFHTIPFKDRKITQGLLEPFGIAYDSFIERIDRLDRLELVDVQFKHVKIPEQNLSIFFFYLAFLKSGLLSLPDLITYYSESNAARLRECVIAANNTFGPAKVMDKVKPALQAHLRKLKIEKRPVESIFTNFWFYLKEETLDHYFQQLSQLDDAAPQTFKLTYETNEFAYNKDKTITLLGNFFHHPDQYLKDSIELIFLYARKKPVHLSEVIHKVRENLSFDRNDLHNGFVRQNTLLDFLINGLDSKDTLLSLSFFELAQTLLQFSFEQFHGSRGNTVRFYTITLHDDPLTRAFRERIWNAVDKYFSDFPIQAFGVLESYSDRWYKADDELVSFDSVYIIAIIKKHLSSDIFEHCRFVQKHMRLFKKKKINHEDIENLKSTFINDSYRIYRKLDWDRLRGREDDGILDYKEFERLKEQEIRSSFVFSGIGQAHSFYDSYTALIQSLRNSWNFDRSLDIVIDENLKADFAIGCGMLQYILVSNNETGYRPWVAFRNHLDDAAKAIAIWELIEGFDFKDKDIWKIHYFQQLSLNPFGPELQDHIVNMLITTDKPVYLPIDDLCRFTGDDNLFYQRLLNVIVSRNRVEGIGLRLHNNIFEESFDRLGTDQTLIEEAYLQQDKLQGHFDYNYKGLKNIVNTRPVFLLDYVRSLYIVDRHRFDSEGEDLSFVWSFDDVESTLQTIFDTVIDEELNLGIGEHFCNCFFKKFENSEHATRGRTFIMNYAKMYNADSVRMNIAVNIARYSLKDTFDAMLAQHLYINQDLEIFSRIWWRGNGGDVMWGDVIFGDIEAAEWRNIQSVISGLAIGLALVPIKRYVSERIDSALAGAEWERERRFREKI